MKSVFLLLLFLVILLTVLFFIDLSLFQISPLPVLIASVGNFLTGLLWYSPLLAGRYLSYETKNLRQSVLQFVGAFFLSLLFTLTFAIFLSQIRPPSLLLSSLMATITWLGFSASNYLRIALWGADDKWNSLIHTGGDLVKFMVTALLFTFFSVSAPLGR